MGDTQALPRLCNGSVLTPIIFGERWLDFSVEQWTIGGSGRRMPGTQLLPLGPDEEREAS